MEEGEQNYANSSASQQEFRGISPMVDLDGLYEFKHGQADKSDGSHATPMSYLMQHNSHRYDHAATHPPTDLIENSNYATPSDLSHREGMLNAPFDSMLHEGLVHMQDPLQGSEPMPNYYTHLSQPPDPSVTNQQQFLSAEALQNFPASESFAQDAPAMIPQMSNETGMHVPYAPKSDDTISLNAILACSNLNPSQNTAITPASVFSTVSSASTNDFLSPLTSPALQPQYSHSYHVSGGERDSLSAHQEILSTKSSPSHSNIRRPSSGIPTNVWNGNAYLSNDISNRSPSSASASASERGSATAARRGRGTTAESKGNKVRSSPFMKPTQSPKIAPGSAPAGSLVWPSNSAQVPNRRLRDASLSNTSPSFGALEAFSHTMQEASNLSMPSPALSPATHATVTHSGSTTPRMLPQSRGNSGSARSRSQTRENHPRHNSLTSPAITMQRSSTLENQDSEVSPLPLSLDSSYENLSQPMSKPMTPGAIMGIAPHPTHSPASSLQGVASSYDSNPAQLPTSVSCNTSAMAQEKVVTPESFVSYQRNPAHATESFGVENAAHAVAVSALSNASQPHAGVYLHSAPPTPKPILPGGLSSEDRNAWLHLRRVGNSGLDQRRTSHKAAEQKRRDSLKQCFDELRNLLPAIVLDENAPYGSLLCPDGSKEDQIAEGFDPSLLQDPSDDSAQEERRPRLYVATPEQAREANATIAKVLLLRHSNEYLVRLKHRVERRDVALQSLSEEVVRLRNALAEQQNNSKDTHSVRHNFREMSLSSQTGEEHNS
ncbi:hypothetical protein MPSI1_000112 [Malassezia psittaci]|uniref:BHLH domain-containing protein n=1 Tax=Malassezia psittaci TaxID=1821823 RepID=A0AAF0FAN6_9BASI|nr:hypothetical protein MPSI1_000112 [Malassezia psittaci]